MKNLKDEELAAQAAQGTIACFEELLSRYRTPVFRYCYRMSGSKEDAEDWTQECFVKIYNNLGKYNPERRFSPWLYRIVHNYGVSVIRVKQSHFYQLVPDQDLAEYPAGSKTDAVDVLEKKLRSEALAEAVDQLSPTLKSALIIWALEDITFKELGEILNTPLPTAAARVRRALIQLRQQFMKTEDKDTI